MLRCKRCATMRACRLCHCRIQWTCSHSDPFTESSGVSPKVTHQALAGAGFEAAPTETVLDTAVVKLCLRLLHPRPDTLPQHTLVWKCRPPTPRRLPAVSTTRMQMRVMMPLHRQCAACHRCAMNWPTSRASNSGSATAAAGAHSPLLLHLQQDPVVLPNMGMACRVSLSAASASTSSTSASANLSSAAGPATRGELSCAS